MIDFMYMFDYNGIMSLTITKARQNLFALADAAARGERVEFAYKGTKFRLVAERKVSKLSRLTPLAVLAEGVTLDSLESDLKDLKTQLQADWEQRQL